jgi:hypothetical protein
MSSPSIPGFGGARPVSPALDQAAEPRSEVIHTCEGTETIQTLITGRDVTGAGRVRTTMRPSGSSTSTVPGCVRRRGECVASPARCAT